MDVTIKNKAHSTGVHHLNNRKRSKFYSPGQLSVFAITTGSLAVLFMQYYLLEWQISVYKFLKEGHNISTMLKKILGISLSGFKDIVIDANSFYIINNAILICTCLVIAFSSVQFIYSLLLGRGRVNRKEIEKELLKLEKLAKNSTLLLADYETELFNHLRAVGVEPIDQIGITRQIIHALENRIIEIRSLLDRKDTNADFIALELLNDKLNYRESTFNSLIQTQDTAVSLRLDANALGVARLLEKQFGKVDKTTREAIMNANRYKKQAA